MKKLALLAGLVSVVAALIGCGDNTPAAPAAPAGSVKTAPMKKGGAAHGMSPNDVVAPPGGARDPYGSKAKPGG